MVTKLYTFVVTGKKKQLTSQKYHVHIFLNILHYFLGTSLPLFSQSVVHCFFDRTSDIFDAQA